MENLRVRETVTEMTQKSQKENKVQIYVKTSHIT